MEKQMIAKCSCGKSFTVEVYLEDPKWKNKQTHTCRKCRNINLKRSNKNADV